MKAYIGALCVLLGTMMLGACDKSDPAPAPAPVPVSAQICAKADECNALPGLSVAECAEQIQSCLDKVSSAKRSDWTLRATDCLRLSTCTGPDSFVYCYNTIPNPGCY